MNAATTEKATAQTMPLLTGYASDVEFFASRFRQGGRLVYSLDLSLAQIASLITPPDPERPSEGNRVVRPKHAEGFANYIRTREEWVAPSLILRTHTTFNFEMQFEVGGIQFGVLRVPHRAMSDLHILDGQHRILGIVKAQEGISYDLDKARDYKAQARRTEGPEGNAVHEAERRIATLEHQRKRLENERMNVQIIVEADSKAYKQMFFDISDNALGITASVRARFDSRKVVNRALPLTSDHPLLAGRVDPEGERIRGSSQYWMGAKHVAEIIRSIAKGLDGRVSKRDEEDLKEADLANRAKDFFDLLVETFPQMESLMLGQLTPAMLRKTSLLGSVLFVRILAGVYYEIIVERGYDREMVAEFFERLAPHVIGPVYEGSIWMTRTAGLYSDGDYSPRSRRQDLTALKNHLVGWVLDKPEWLLEAPAPRPVEEPEDDEEYGSGYTAFGADIPQK